MRALTVVPGQANSERLITRRVPVARWAEAPTREPGDVEPIIQFAA